MRYSVAIFDFDGTVFDTSEGITQHVARSVREMGFPELPMETLKKFIGPSLLVSFRKYCGMTTEQANEAIAIYRREYDIDGYKKSCMYPGMSELLTSLREQGVVTIVASAKPQYLLDATMDFFDMRRYFDAVCGSEKEERSSSDKKEIVARAIGDNVNCVMIGDSVYDIQGGRDNGVDTVAVTYGFGFSGEQEAIGSGATYIAHSVKELKDILYS